MDSKLFTLHTIETLWNKIKNKFYVKPANGIPKSDLDTTVQSSLSKADTALQKHQDISGKQDKLTAGTNITISGNTISAKDTTYTSKSAVSGGKDVSLVTTGEKAIWNAKTSNVGTITGIKMNGASKGTSGVVDLGTVITAHQDISGKQDKSTAVTHSANTVVGSATKPVYVAANGAATPISHSINADVPANAKFTDTTYGDATESTRGLMTAADKKKLDGMDLTKYLPKDGTAVAAAKLSTARKINTIPFDGTKDITIPRSGMVCHEAGGTGGQHGYVKIATIKITARYADMPTIIYYRNRGAFPVKLVIMFSTSDTTDPGLYVLEQTVELVNYNWKRAYMNKTAAGMWDLIIAKSEEWDSVQILDCQPAKHVSVTFTNAHISTLPSTAITSTVYERAMVTSTVAAAKTLTDSGWIIPTFPSGIKNSTIRYRKQGKIVSVSGYVTFSESVSAKVVLTLPEGYRPPAKIQQFNAIDGSAQPSFLTTIDTNGKVSFVGKTQGFFTTANEYYIHCTFFVD